MTEPHKEMEPRDIVQPSATILGLIVTAVGILVALAGTGQNQLNIVRNFGVMFIVVVIFFVIASASRPFLLSSKGAHYGIMHLFPT